MLCLTKAICCHKRNFRNWKEYINEDASWGFKPQQGTIDICLENGKTIQASPDTRCMFSYVPQGNYLFSGTIRENILMINPNASDEEVSQALKLSEIEDLLKNYLTD